MTNVSVCVLGTGITPMLQIIRAILKSSTDRVHMRLVYANQTEGDILLRKELDELAAAVYPTGSTLRVYYTLDRPPTDGSWRYGSGFVTQDMCRENLPSSSDPSTMVFLCGPPPMIQYACEPALAALGFQQDQIHVF